MLNLQKAIKSIQSELGFDINDEDKLENIIEKFIIKSLKLFRVEQLFHQFQKQKNG